MGCREINIRIAEITKITTAAEGGPQRNLRSFSIDVSMNE